ncbi:bifunctional YncE family protein/alkaline phosphatase family protein [Lichenicoccus roseus]|uniref:Bifunctional YncE family protein/alkaline phosphatase family protein n=1 Tax=Lichenicoccus roseus TaxID=2683649 RepID=A0A5R9J8D0_9PROT|nr:bifunctional YncE family protein/alkaline phosphatase family protein [Lichenicoccus roseus]TLU72797.1 bifunctional YncE family protein/alkaline phosphatase family protein [Lichenicoccus roseus]
MSQEFKVTMSFRKHPLAGVMALALAAPGIACAQTSPQTTRTVGPQTNGTIVASDNQLLTPTGKIVQLGSPIVAKAVAVNPNPSTRSGAVLLMDAAQPIIVFDTKTGAVLQRYIPSAVSGTTFTSNTTGSFTGVTYSPDGSKLLFSQDNNFVAVANVNPANGELTPAISIPVPPPPANPNLYNATSANPGGVVATGTALGMVVLNANNSVGVLNLSTATLEKQIAVGNAPNSIVVSGDYAYVSNEGGRPATSSDFTNLSDGTPIVADPTDAFATTGTVSVIDTRTGTVTKTINVGLHPAGMAVSGSKLYVANSYDDTISVIDTGLQKVVRTIPVGVPIKGGAFGAGANGIAIAGNHAYVTLGQSNAVAVVDLANNSANPVIGYIPTLYFPTTIAYDAANSQLVVSNDKGLGAQGSIGTAHGVSAFNTHQETGTVNLIPLPNPIQLVKLTARVIRNNHWDSRNILVGSEYANPNAKPVAIPAHIGEPSLIKHVFLVIKENRTYDQMLGDVPQGNGDPSLAVFAANVPNQHALVQRFPLLDNVYAPSRQSADGHPWIVESGSFYSNDILSPDWIRSYPGGNSNDALTYTQKGFLWSAAEARGLNVKMYGEWSNHYTIAGKPGGGTYSWADFYNTSLYKESGGTAGSNVVPDNSDTEVAYIPSVVKILDPHYPSFNLGIPDQYRMDYYLPVLAAQDAANAVPDLTILWLPDDHTNGTTTGYPLPNNYEADNDLALGRMVEAISKTKAWPTSAIFVEEDDSQDGVDHIDGHRQPVYVISPYTAAPQAANVGRVIHTTYTQENINRTIENILDLPPLTQFDLTASPMFDVFQNTADTAPFTHVPATTPLNIGPGGTPIAGTGAANYTMNMHMSPLQKAWNVASNRMTRGKQGHADSVDENFLNHVIWYSATNWQRAYPGEAHIQWPAKLVASALRSPVVDKDD